jgi:hypothetical protein
VIACANFARSARESPADAANGPMEINKKRARQPPKRDMITDLGFRGAGDVEQVTGIEPAPSAWEVSSPVRGLPAGTVSSLREPQDWPPPNST